MVYVYAKLSNLNKYLEEELSVEQIEDTLIDMGMDLKGVSEETDPELKIELTAEKLDLISVVGIARAINFYRGNTTKIKDYKISLGKNKIIVDKSVESIRGKTVAAIIRGVPMNQEFLDEIIEIQEKIHASFGRQRKKAAIGIYPVEKINFPISYKAEKPENIVFKPLDSEEMTGFEILENHDTGKKFAHLLKDFDLFPVFRDSKNNILSMPPIINSNEMGRVGTGDSDLFIECTGHNLQHLDNILKVLVTTFIEMGANAESVSIEYPDGDVYELNLNNIKDSFSLSYVNKIIGINLDVKSLKPILSKMMFKFVSNQGDKINIEIPAFRSDVFNDIDIADDIARGYGYNNIIPSFPNISSVGNTLKINDFKERFSEIMTNLGFLELYTYMLSSTTLHFKNMGLDESKFKFIKLIDSEDQGINIIRNIILPDNLESLHINRKNKYPQRVFENSWTIQVSEKDETGAKNEGHLSVSIADPKSNYTQIKEILDTLMKLNNIDFEVRESNLIYLIEGRQAEILIGDEVVGFIGEVNPQVLVNFGLIVPVSSMELNLEKIYDLLN